MLTSKDLIIFFAALATLIVVIVRWHGDRANRTSPPAATPPPANLTSASEKTGVEGDDNKGRRPGGE